MAPVLPQVVIPVARRVLREMVGHLIVDATDAKLGPAIAKIRKDGIKLNVNLLGEAVLGEHEAARRLEGTHDPARPRPTSTTSRSRSPPPWPPHSALGLRRGRGARRREAHPALRPAPPPSPRRRPKFINLDMEEYKDLDMTIAVFTRILDKPEFKDLEAGIVLQAYLPGRPAAMIRLQDWAAARRADGGAAIKVRVVKGANLPMEQVEASLHDWPLATWDTKQDSDTNYKRVINYSLHPDRIDATSGSASPATTSSTSPSPGCWPSSAASRIRRSNSRCCSAWPRARPRPSSRTSAPSCSTPPWSTRPSSTSRSPT